MAVSEVVVNNEYPVVSETPPYLANDSDRHAEVATAYEAGISEGRLLIRDRSGRPRLETALARVDNDVTLIVIRVDAGEYDG